jgi:hypothetical protein
MCDKMNPRDEQTKHRDQIRPDSGIPGLEVFDPIAGSGGFLKEILRHLPDPEGALENGDDEEDSDGQA